MLVNKNSLYFVSLTYQAQIEEFCQLWQSGKQLFQLQTSGSTGTPKTITLTRTQIHASIQATQKALRLTNAMTALTCLNVNYIAGKMMLARSMQIGMKMIVVEPSANPLSEISDNIKIDFVAFVPLQLQTMLEANLHERLNQMQVIIVGGAAISNSLLAQIKTLKVPVYSTYGMTETVSHVALQKLNGTDAADFYKLLPNIEAATDERGCLRLRGAVTSNEWIQTNDVVEFENETAFKVIGRADNIINSGGIKIQLEKVETAIEKIWKSPNRYFVWWLPDERLGQKLILIVEADSLQIADIQQEIANTLPPYETPKAIYTVPRFLETPTGKIDKRATALLITEGFDRV